MLRVFCTAPQRHLPCSGEGKYCLNSLRGKRRNTETVGKDHKSDGWRLCAYSVAGPPNADSKPWRFRKALQNRSSRMQIAPMKFSFKYRFRLQFKYSLHTARTAARTASVAGRSARGEWHISWALWFALRLALPWLVVAANRKEPSYGKRPRWRRPRKDGWRCKCAPSNDELSCKFETLSTMGTKGGSQESLFSADVSLPIVSTQLLVLLVYTCWQAPSLEGWRGCTTTRYGR